MHCSVNLYLRCTPPPPTSSALSVKNSANDHSDKDKGAVTRAEGGLTHGYVHLVGPQPLAAGAADLAAVAAAVVLHRVRNLKHTAERTESCDPSPSTGSHARAEQPALTVSFLLVAPGMGAPFLCHWYRGIGRPTAPHSSCRVSPTYSRWARGWIASFSRPSGD